MEIERIARICHEVNRAICEAAGDFTQKSWGDAEEWQRLSAIEGVQFSIDNPKASAYEQHNAWVRDKKSDGWVYGETKDADKKTHPCLVAYDDLPFEQQVKDHVFKAIVSELIRR